MYKEIRDENAEKMRDVAKTIKPTERFQNSGGDGLEKAGAIASQFFAQPEISVQHLSTEELVQSLAGEGDGRRNLAFREGLKALYPGFPELWNTPRPTVGNMASRPLDYMDTGRGGYPEPAKALAVAIQRNAAAKALSKAVKETGGDGLEDYRKRIVALMPPEVLKHYEQALASA